MKIAKNNNQKEDKSLKTLKKYQARQPQNKKGINQINKNVVKQAIKKETKTPSRTIL